MNYHKSMRTFAKWCAGIFVLLVVGAILFPVVARYLPQPRQRRIQQSILTVSFAKIQQQNGKAWMVPSQRHFLWRHLDKPILASVGTQFRFNDRHWHGKYTVTRIDDEGVSIYFEADGGGAGTNVLPSRGTVKLAWK